MLAPQVTINSRYEVVKMLGQGGMGAVYLAKDQATQQQVAVKVLSLGPGDSQLRFRREFRVMSRLDHPNIIKTIESGTYGELPYLVMDFLSGGTLLERFPGGASGAADLPPRLEIMVQVAEALAYIHAQGIIHRDLKPENVMLEDGRAKLMDFGLAKSETQATVALTKMGMIMGTASYMSPEQARGLEADARSDLYAFGCLLYWMLVGEPPFTGTSFPEILMRQLHEPAQEPSSRNGVIPRSLDNLTLKLLEKLPEDRYSAASDVAAELRAVLKSLRGALAAGAEPSVLEEEAVPAQLLRPPLIGREGEWQQLRRVLQADEGKVVVVQAAAGLGLSRLLDDVHNEARARHYASLKLTFAKVMGVPYQVWKEALSRLQKLLPRDFAEAAAGLGPALAPLLPELAPASQSDLPPDIAQLRLYDGVDQLLSRLAKKTPLLIVIDDLQSADEGTVGLLAYLARGASAQVARILVGLHPNRASKAVLNTLKGLEADHIDLPPLSEEAMQRLVQALLGGEIEPQLSKHVTGRAAGNPFFAQEILQALLKAGHITRRAGVWEWSRAAITIPPSIEEVFVQRLERLSERTQKTISVASAIGQSFGFELLLELLDADEDDLLDDLDELLRAGLISESRTDTYTFTHPLLRDLLHDKLNARRRRRYHQHLAESLQERKDTPPEVLAEHYAETDSPERAVPYALEVARRAQAIYANDVAETFFRLALKVMSEDAEERHQVMLELGEVLERIGRWEEARGLYEGAAEGNLQERALHRLGLLRQRQGDIQQSEEYLRNSLALDPWQVGVYSDLGRTLIMKGDFDAANEVLQKGLSLSTTIVHGREDAMVCAYIDLADLEFHRGQWDSALSELEHARILVAPENKLLNGRIFTLMAVVNHMKGNVSLAKSFYEQAREAYLVAGDVGKLLIVLQNLAIAYSDLGEQERALQVLDEVRRRAYHVGDATEVARAATTQAEELMKLGRYSEAQSSLEEASQTFKELGAMHYEAYARLNLISALTKQVKLDEAEIQLELVKDLLEQAPQEHYSILLRLRQGELALRGGKLQEAHTMLTAVVAALSEMDSKQELLEAHLLLAEGSMALADSAAAKHSLDETVALAQVYQDPVLNLQIAYLKALNEGREVEAGELKEELEASAQKHFVGLIQATVIASRKAS